MSQSEKSFLSNSKMTSLLEELNNSYEDNHNQEKMTVEKMKETISDEISPVEKGPPKKFRLGLVI